jgi:hypothetical protein
VDGSQVAILVAIIVVILLAVNAGRRGRSNDGGAYPWWTLGLFAIGSRNEEEAREARDDARLAGDEPMNPSGSPEDRVGSIEAADADAGAGYGGGGGGAEDGGDSGGDGDSGSDD